MWLFVCAAFLFGSPPTMEFVAVTTLAPIPDDSEVFLQRPWDAAVSPNGQVYLLDQEAVTVFHWGSDGAYLGNFGKKGQGPGDLTLNVRRGGPQGSISTRGEEVVIYDGGLRRINRYKADGTFISSVNFSLPRGRTESFRPLRNGFYLVHHRRFGGDTPVTQVGIFKEGGTEVKNLFQMEDRSWRRRTDGQRGVVIVGYARKVFVHYDATTDRIIIADSDQTEAVLYNADGELQGKISFKLPRVEVTDEDKAEFQEIRRLRGNKRFQFDFPEKHRYFDYVLPHQNQGFLVFRESPVARHLRGLMIDAQGKTTGRIHLSLGEESRIFGSNGRFLMIKTNEDGDFDLSLAGPRLKTS